MKKDFTSSLKDNQFKHSLSLKDAEIDKLKKKLHEKSEQISHLSTFINIDDIKIVRNKRSNYKYQDLESLQNDIQKNGQLQAVTLTNDNYLLAGHRRYYAIQNLTNQKKHDGKVLFIALAENFEDIGQELFDKYQLSENEQRKSFDNLELSSLFQEYKSRGYTQNQIADIFGKTKTFVSACISLENIAAYLKELIQEIQYFGMTKKKLNESNLQEKDNIQNDIIGINTLVKIARYTKKSDQNQAFLDVFSSKLSKEELKKLGAVDDIHISKATKFKNSINTKFSSLKKVYKDENSKLILEEADKALNELNLILDKLES